MSDDGPAMPAGPGPSEVHDPVVRNELKRAAVWLGMAAMIGLVVLLIQPLLLIFAGLVFAALLDGGVRLLGRVLPIGRGWRLLIVSIAATAFIVGTFYLTGVEVAQQARQLGQTIEVQATRFAAWLTGLGLMPAQAELASFGRDLLGSVGRVTSFVGSAFGAIAGLFMIIVIGLFVAIEPRLYERGLAWLLPTRERAYFEVTLDRMAHTMRRLLAGRLLGMAVEGVLTWLLLMVGGVPMALLLGILAFILAFIPNIGAFILGLLMVAVGFSAGLETGIWAIGVYVVVQIFDGYIVVPMVAKKTVDLPPALTLGSQILFAALFGFMGLVLADPMIAMIKVALERQSERSAANGGRKRARPG